MAPHGSTLRDDQAAARSSNDNLWLEVRRGLTRSRRRPVRSQRFLIGAGSNCQLQLGGEEIPILHSILLVNEEGAHIDALVNAPELLVNGVPQRAADLQHGDVFSIGRFEFAVNVPDGTIVSQTAVEELPLTDLGNLEEMSAAELVERIEQEQACVDRFENARAEGARALLQSIARRAREMSGRQQPDAIDPDESVRVLRIPERDASPELAEIGADGHPQRRAS